MAPNGFFVSQTEDLQANMPVLQVGQHYFATDTQLLFVGTTGGNILVGPSQGIGPTVTVTGVPTVGQVPTATAPWSATWQTPASGGAAPKTARVAMGTIASATPSLVTAYTWPTAFADNNYTITGQVVIAETPPAGAATAIVCIGSIQLQASGVGFNFVVCNADGVPHNVVANFIAIHD